MMRVTNILFTVAFARGALAQVWNPLNERAACNRDNLFRCFIDQRYSSQASQFCAGLEPFTVTVASSIATTTTAKETTITAKAVEITEVHTTTIFTETIPTATTIVTADSAGVAKRQVAASPPKCMTNGVTYPSGRVTSACSCIEVPASTVSVTYVVSTETITEVGQSYCARRSTADTLLQINTVVTTPFTTVTSWKTVSTDTTGGIATVTVLPPQINRLVNGDFETGDSTGWELTPDSWKAEVYDTGTAMSPLSYVVNGSEGSLGYLRQIKPVYLEVGTYEIGLLAPPARFPKNTDYWREVVVFELVNRAGQTTITPTFEGTKIMIMYDAFDDRNLAQCGMGGSDASKAFHEFQAMT
ncbi:carbohydrate binding domain-containing [Fusarium longipes]|uniref:Carbohydrate binding domain-containing n=1 Tax=Fusarium longipes TaxID=694270 RepID=A0A395SXQ2_9HYPO|nr:carbohydrate binding domain-containing [Fusarium longipes]